METNLYLQIQNNLVRGRNIETMLFESWINKQDEPEGRVVITYLCGETVILPVGPVVTPEERTVILDTICELQEQPCYPHTETPCELGITSLN